MKERNIVNKLTMENTGITIDDYIREWELKYYRLFGHNSRKLLKERQRLVGVLHEPVLVIATKRQALLNIIRKRRN